MMEPLNASITGASLFAAEFFISELCVHKEIPDKYRNACMADVRKYKCEEVETNGELDFMQMFQCFG